MIDVLKVKNFKCFENLELELSNLNVFCGINSMGKSTVIQALLLLHQAYGQNVLMDGIYLNGTEVSIGSGRDLLYEDAQDNIIGISLKSGQNEINWHYRYESEADFLMVERDSLKRDFLQKDWNLFGTDFTYIAADRLGPQTSYQKSYYEVHENNWLGIRGEYAVHYLREHSEDEVVNKNLLAGEETGVRLLSVVEAWMREITPGLAFSIEDYGHANQVGLMVHQKSTMASSYYTAQNVGFGISYVLPIVLALVKAQKDTLVIVENPEAHLHPKAQRKMGELIAKSAQGGSQIIVETHSDHVLNGIRLSAKRENIDCEKVKMYYFTRDYESEKIVPVVEKPVLRADGRLSYWPDGFFDEWDKAIDELF